MEPAQIADHKRVVALAVDGSEHAEHALSCKYKMFVFFSLKTALSSH